ncbi:hypothetical protein GQ42DRAFT_158911 [Ramicandelaber brevisporus]|nr:hypothetical protein GQ42DRAFT_158911 [Ramicandelaber brevisporus]
MDFGYICDDLLRFTSLWRHKIVSKIDHSDGNQLQWWEERVKMQVNEQTDGPLCDDAVMSRLERMSIEYQLPSAISSIVSSSTMAAYRRLGSFILKVRYANYLLHSPAVTAKSPNTIQQPHGSGDSVYRQVCALRFRLLAFTNGLLFYLLNSVADSGSQQFFALQSAAQADSHDGSHSNLPAIDITIIHSQMLQIMNDRCLLHHKAAALYGELMVPINACARLHKLAARIHAQKQQQQQQQRRAPSDLDIAGELEAMKRDIDRAQRFLQNSLGVLARLTSDDHYQMLATVISDSLESNTRA